MDRDENQQNIFLYQESKPEQFADTELIQRAMQGDRSAFSDLFMQTYRHVFLLVQSSLSREEDQYDALQSIYLRVYKGIGKLESPFAFMSWLNTIAANVCKDYYRRTEHWKKESSAADSIAEEHTEQTDIALDVREVLRQLPEEQAQLLTMYYYDGLKLSEIARLTDTPASTVRSRFHAAKKALRLLFEEKQIDKNFYSKGFFTWITTSLRNAVGTNLLSAAVAQDILDSVILAGEKMKGKQEVVTAKYFLKRRNAAVLRIASIVTAISILASCLTVFALRQGREKPTGGQLTVTGDVSETSTSEGRTSSLPSVQGSSSQDTTGIPAASDSTDHPESSRVNGSSSSVLSSLSSDSTSSVDNFVPDYLPGQANTVGNTPNNLMRQAMCAYQGDWLYYRINYGQLYKIRRDGSGKELITETFDSIYSLNVVGDWIYYDNNGGEICRIRTDGTKQEVVKETTRHAHLIYVAGDLLYYNQYNTIRTVDLNTREERIIVSDSGDYYSVSGDYLLYFSEASTFNCLQLSTGKTVSYRENLTSSNWLLRGDRVYFLDSYHNVRVLDYTKADAKSKILLEAGPDFVENLLYLAEDKNDWLLCKVHMKNGAYELWQINVETGQVRNVQTSIFSGDSCDRWLFLDLGDGYLYAWNGTDPGMTQLNQDLTLSKRFS